MTDNNYLLSNYDFNDENIVNVYDELSLWAAPFGMKLLDKIPYKRNTKALDIGCGVGFPLIEVAQRLGNSSTVIGLDVWEEAFKKVRYKCDVMGINNVKCINGSANQMPFCDDTFDLIVSNNGINNTGDELKTLKECYRVCNKNGKFIFTINLPDTMKEFYKIFTEVLLDKNMNDKLVVLDEHINKHRKTIEQMREYIEAAGFTIDEIEEDVFHMRFCDGSTMFNYHFIKLCFLTPWINIVGKDLANDIFGDIENRLNKYADVNNGLALTIPYACFVCSK